MSIKKQCKICNKIFFVSPSRERIKNCSVICGILSRQTKIKISCARCKKYFFVTRYRYNNNLVKFCSKKCFGMSNRGKNNYLWKDKNASYRTIHNWVTRHFGSANHCSDCGLNIIPKGKKRYFQWANISKKYKRDISDWKQLCVKCHKFFDKT